MVILDEEGISLDENHRQQNESMVGYPFVQCSFAFSSEHERLVENEA